MLAKLYFLLALVRVYFATVPSYIHPDEHFQGPEVIIGHVFGWPAHKTWEFTSDDPIRSIFPLSFVYVPPLTLLKWISEGLGRDVSPMAIFYVLRTLMVLLSFVLEDWAIYELLPRKKDRAFALTLIASSYVTWTYQSHTFSNSIETIVVLWCMVLINRICDHSDRTQVRACASLAFLGVFGFFNRITFPAFIVVPLIDLVPALFVKAGRLPTLLVTGALTTLFAVMTDTEHYGGHSLKFREPLSSAVLTPWNNLKYNMDNANLAEHGLHPFWQHFVANLPQLIGPAVPLLFTCRRTKLFWSGIIGVAILSCFKHQEARFLLPAVPLLLSAVRLPTCMPQFWISTWIIFNLIAATLFGIYHQAGVIPVQNWISHQPDVGRVLWWKTYSPPHWFLGNRNLNIATSDLMGMPGDQMIETLAASTICNGKNNKTLLVVPSSATYLDTYSPKSKKSVHVEPVFTYRNHIGLDDLDFGDDGVMPTLERVIGRRGLTVWEASKKC